MLKIKKTWLRNIHRVKNEVNSRHKYLRLDKNEKISKFTKKKWTNFISSLTQNDFQAYPEIEDFYHNLSKKIKIKRNNIFLCSGSDNAIKNFFEIFTTSNSKILTSNPSFPMYKVYSKIYNNQIVYVNYKNNFELNKSEFLNKITKKIDAIILANPNSPVGDLILEKELTKILKKSKKFGIPFFLDQAYFEFSNTDMKNLIKKFDNLIISRTFSKGMGAAGVRLGYIIADEKIINLFEKTRPLYEINQIAVKYGMFVLKNYTSTIKYCKQTIKSRDILCKILKDKQINVINSKTNSIHINFGRKIKKVEKILKKFRILFKYSSMPNSNYKYWIRLTVFPKIEKEKFIKEILICHK